MAAVFDNRNSYLQSFTPTGTWTTNTTYTGFWKRNAEYLELDIKITLSGAPDAVSLNINIPFGLTIDTAKLFSAIGGDSTPIQGSEVVLRDNANNDNYGVVKYLTSTTVAVFYFVVSGSVISGNNVASGSPFAWGNLDGISIKFKVPIVGWS